MKLPSMMIRAPGSGCPSPSVTEPLSSYCAYNPDDRTNKKRLRIYLMFIGIDMNMRGQILPWFLLSIT